MKHSAFGAVAALVAMLATPAVAETRLVVAGSEAVDSLLDRMSVKFAEALEANGGDAFDVNLIRGQSLGNAQQVMEQHQAGSVDVMYSRPDWLTSNVDTSGNPGVLRGPVIRRVSSTGGPDGDAARILGFRGTVEGDFGGRRPA